MSILRNRINSRIEKQASLQNAIKIIEADIGKTWEPFRKSPLLEKREELISLYNASKQVDPKNKDMIEAIRDKAHYEIKNIAMSKNNKIGRETTNILGNISRANAKGRVEQANKLIDTGLTRRHDINANKPLPSHIVSPDKEKIYYSGKTIDYKPGGKNDTSLQPSKILVKTKEAPIWVTPQPRVAARYAHGDEGTIFAFRNTPELVEGGTIRTHKHIATDSRKMSEATIAAREKADGRFFGISGTEGIPNYERVLSYKPEVFRSNLDGVYGKVKDEPQTYLKYYYDEPASSKHKKPIIVRDTPTYALRGKRRQEAEELLFNEKVEMPRDVVKETAKNPDFHNIVGGTLAATGIGIGGLELLEHRYNKKKEARMEKLRKNIKNKE